MQVWIVHYSHRHGEDTYVFDYAITEDEAADFLADVYEPNRDDEFIDVTSTEVISREEVQKELERMKQEKEQTREE